MFQFNVAAAIAAVIVVGKESVNASSEPNKSVPMQLPKRSQFIPLATIGASQTSCTRTIDYGPISDQYHDAL
jgi:hypothetical protein